MATSTARNRNACLCCSLRLVDAPCRGRSARASLRPARSTKRRWRASRPKLGVARPQRPSPASGSGTSRRRSRRCAAGPGSFSPQLLLGIDQRAGDLEVLVHRLARHEQVHDLARALEDPVDAVVAHHALDRDRRLAARLERALGLVAAAAADLHGVVDDLPGAGGVPLLGRRRLEPDVVGRRGRPSRLARSATASIAKVVAAMSAIMCAIASCLPIGWPHCTRAAAQLAADLEAALGGAHRAVGDRQPAVVERGERDLEALALLADQVLARHAHVVEARSPRWRAPCRPMKWQRCSTSTPGQAVSTTKALIFLLFGIARHHHQQLGERAVGAPQLLAVEDVGVAVGRELGAWSRGAPGRSRPPARSARRPRSRRARSAAGTSSSAPRCRRA